MLRTKTVTYEGYTVTVQSDTRGTALYEAQYKRILYEAYPEAASFRRTIDSIRVPSPDDEAARDTYNSEIANAINRDELGSRAVSRINEFGILASHIHSSDGTEWKGAQPMSPGDVRAAFEQFLSEDRDDGLWHEITQAILELSEVAQDTKGEPVSAGGR